MAVNLQKERTERNELSAGDRAKVIEIMEDFAVSGAKYHVVSYKNGWGVFREGGKRFLKIHPDKTDAINQAKALIKKHSGQLIIHAKNGAISNLKSLARQYSRTKTTAKSNG